LTVTLHKMGWKRKTVAL